MARTKATKRRTIGTNSQIKKMIANKNKRQAGSNPDNTPVRTPTYLEIVKQSKKEHYKNPLPSSPDYYPTSPSYAPASPAYSSYCVEADSNEDNVSKPGLLSEVGRGHSFDDISNRTVFDKDWGQFIVETYLKSHETVDYGMCDPVVSTLDTGHGKENRSLHMFTNPLYVNELVAGTGFKTLKEIQASISTAEPKLEAPKHPIEHLDILALDYMMEKLDWSINKKPAYVSLPTWRVAFLVFCLGRKATKDEFKALLENDADFKDKADALMWCSENGHQKPDWNNAAKDAIHRISPVILNTLISVEGFRLGTKLASSFNSRTSNLTQVEQLAFMLLGCVYGHTAPETEE